MITQNELKANLWYEPDTGFFFRLGCTAAKQAGRIHHKGYRDITIKGVYYGAHRLAWLYVHGSWPDGHIDHINGDKLDNRISNLRLATEQQNQMNRKRCSANTSGVKGAFWSKQHRKWSARISVNGKRVHVGLFGDIADASLALSKARERLHGEFANDG